MFRNNQSKYFIDSSGTIDKDNIIERMSQFDFIGITEHHNESLRWFADLHHIKANEIQDEVINRNPSYKVSRDILENSLVDDFLQDYNEIDIELYNYFYPLAAQTFRRLNENTMTGLKSADS